MTITSRLPVSVHPDAPYIVYDADGNRVAECGDAFLHLWPGDSGIKKLHDAETMAAELVRVLNTHDDIRTLLVQAHEFMMSDPHYMGSDLYEDVNQGLAASYMEPVS